MTKVLGVVNHGVYFVMNMLRIYNRRRKRKDGGIKVTVGKVRPNTDVAIFKTVPNLMMNSAAVERSGCVAIVFDDPVTCDSVSPITLLDVERKYGRFLYQYSSLTLDKFTHFLDGALKASQHAAIKRIPVDVIDVVMEETKSSPLQPIMKYLSSVKPASQREQVQLRVYEWLVSAESKNELATTLLKSAASSESSVKRLYESLSMDEVEGLRSLYKEGRTDLYDVRYVNKVLSKGERNGNV